jgi:uncharacterized protein (DUF302 family)
MPGDGDDDMWAQEGETTDDVVSFFEQSSAHGDATVDALTLDWMGKVPWWPEEIRDVTLSTVLVHLTTEVHRHAGHADIVRETIDGVVGLQHPGHNVAERDAASWSEYRARIEAAARSATSTPPTVTAGATTKDSPRPAKETVARLTGLIEARGMKLFAVIDQAAEARSVELDLRPTTLVVFGSPVAGTPVMDAAPLSALDLPLKVLVWADGEQTKVSYVAPTTLAERYALDPSLAHNLAGIDAITDALVQP